jgi:Ca2+-binding RTX toxin-like protein
MSTMRPFSAVLFSLATIVSPVVALTGPPAAQAAERVTCAGKVATIVGTAGDDVLTGTPGGDVIAGLSGADTIVGGGGNDTICGGGGDDTISAQSPNNDPADVRATLDLRGGTGNDHLSGSAGHTYYDGGPGDDVVRNVAPAAYYTVDYTPSPGHDSFTSTKGSGSVPPHQPPPPKVSVSFKGVSSSVHLDLRAGMATFGPNSTSFHVVRGTHWHVVGSFQDDVLDGSDGEDTINGTRGDDVLWGRGGNDFLDGDQGRDDVHGGSGNDNVSVQFQDHGFGGSGNDTVGGSILPGGGAVIRGGTGNNTLLMGISGSRTGGRTYRHALVDLARGVVVVDGLRSRISGFASVSAGDGRVGSWTLKGTGGPNVLVGSPLIRVVERGRASDDVLIGGAADDLLDGGPGTDQADAGAGVDTCVSIEGPILPRYHRTHCEHVR